jgi:acetylglutamate kinase
MRRTRSESDSNIEKILDLGFVGEPTEIDSRLLDDLAQSNLIPVIAPLGTGSDGETYNINADTAAGAIAGAIESARLLMLTDVSGVLDKDGKLIPDMNVDEARAYIDDGTITSGMIPKVETCIGAVQAEVEAAVILDGRTDHAILLEVFTDHGVGTAIWPK